MQTPEVPFNTRFCFRDNLYVRSNLAAFCIVIDGSTGENAAVVHKPRFFVSPARTLPPSPVARSSTAGVKDLFFTLVRRSFPLGIVCMGAPPNLPSQRGGALLVFSPSLSCALFITIVTSSSLLSFLVCSSIRAHEEREHRVIKNRRWRGHYFGYGAFCRATFNAFPPLKGGPRGTSYVSLLLHLWCDTRTVRGKCVSVIPRNISSRAR